MGGGGQQNRTKINFATPKQKNPSNGDTRSTKPSPRPKQTKTTTLAQPTAATHHSTTSTFYSTWQALSSMLTNTKNNNNNKISSQQPTHDRLFDDSNLLFDAASLTINAAMKDFHHTTNTKHDNHTEFLSQQSTDNTIKINSLTTIWVRVVTKYSGNKTQQQTSPQW
jgi:hypothetical protein